MLPRSGRLFLEKDIERVLRLGHARHHVFFTLKAAPNQLGKNRATVVVGTKVSKKATERNTLKRRLRVVLADVVLPKMAGMDAVLIGRAAAKGVALSELRKAATSLFIPKRQV